jgi:hypothetical protein
MMNRDPIEINGRIWEYDPSSRTHRPAQAVNHNHDSGQAADVELSVSGQSVQACKGAAFGSRVDIEIVSYRSRLADADGISGKAAIDGIVAAGILREDSAKEVREVRFRQIKVQNETDEKTEIIIQEI